MKRNREEPDQLEWLAQEYARLKERYDQVCQELAKLKEKKR